MMSPSEVELLPGLDGICNELLQEDGYGFCSLIDVYFFFYIDKYATKSDKCSTAISIVKLVLLY